MNNLKNNLGALYGKICFEGQGGFTYHTEIPYVARRRLHLVIEEYSVSPEKRGEVGAYQFYIDRLFASLNYGERSGMEIVKTVYRCAFADEVLTDAESISIINICHSPVTKPVQSSRHLSFQ